MSNNQQFDEHIKDQFQDYTPQVHPRIWENIIAEREKRRPAGFWVNFFNRRNTLLLAALLLASVSGAYLLLKNTTDKQQTDIATAPANTLKTTTVASVDENNVDESNNNNQEATNTVIDKENVAALPVNDNTIITNNKSTVLSTAKNSKIKLYSAFAQTDDNNAAPNKKKRNNTAGTADDDYAIADAALTYTTSLSPEYSLNKLFFVAQKNSSKKNELMLSKRFLPNVNLPGCPSIEENAAGNKTYIEIYGGPDIAFRSLSDTGNSTYLQKRKESTKFSSAYSAGIRYTRVFGNGMSIRTGVNYSQINEKFTYVQGNLVQITYIIDANGDTTGSYITTGTRYKTTHNKFRTIDVPLLIGYELGNGKFHANINAGVIINAYSWQKGEVLDASLRPVSITTGKANSPYQYKTNIGLGFMTGISAYYKLNEKVHILAEPYFRYSLSPMSKENLTFKQKYNTAGLRLGIRFDLQ
jgi:hypothetical protein